MKVMFDINQFSIEPTDCVYNFWLNLLKELQLSGESEPVLATLGKSSDILQTEISEYIKRENIVEYLPLDQVSLFPWGTNYSRKFSERLFNRMWLKSMHMAEKMSAKTRISYYFSGKADIYHATINSKIEVFIPKITTISDLNFIRHPEFYSENEILNNKKQLDFHAKHSNAITVLSETAKRDLIEATNIDAERIHVIYPGIDSAFYVDKSFEKAQGILDITGVANHPFFVCLPTFEFQKNYIQTLKAFEQFKLAGKFDDYHLLVIGQEKSEHIKIISETKIPALKSFVHFSGILTKDEIRQLFNKATALIFPNVCDGFDFLPVLALASGCPTVASKSAELSEILGGHAEYVAANDPKDIARGMTAIANDKAYRKLLITRGAKWVKRYSYTKMADEMTTLYREVLRDQPTLRERKLLSPTKQIKRWLQNKTNDSTCPHCKSKDFDLLYKCEEYETYMEVRTCQKCSLVYSWPIRKKEELKEFYDKNYKTGNQSADDVIQQKLPQNISKSIFNRSREISFISKFIKSGRMLDVGCSWGYLLSQARDLGYEVYGTELSGPYGKIGRDALGIEIREGTLEESQWPDNFFDCITLIHSFEHFESPWNSVRELARILKPGGYIMIIVPNFDSYLRKLLGIGWSWLSPDVHYFHFTKAMLKSIFSPTFTIVDWHSEEGHYGKEIINKYLTDKEYLKVTKELAGSELIMTVQKTIEQ